MDKINWKQKLTSRKLWFALAGFVVGLYIFFGGSTERAEELGGLIMSAASVVAYIFGEGLIDAKRAGQDQLLVLGDCATEDASDGEDSE